jgi:hypothetical protein
VSRCTCILEHSVRGCVVAQLAIAHRPSRTQRGPVQNSPRQQQRRTSTGPRLYPSARTPRWGRWHTISTQIYRVKISRGQRPRKDDRRTRYRLEGSTSIAADLARVRFERYGFQMSLQPLAQTTSKHHSLSLFVATTNWRAARSSARAVSAVPTRPCGECGVLAERRLARSSWPSGSRAGNGLHSRSGHDLFRHCGGRRTERLTVISVTVITVQLWAGPLVLGVLGADSAHIPWI